MRKNPVRSVNKNVTKPSKEEITDKEEIKAVDLTLYTKQLQEWYARGIITVERQNIKEFNACLNKLTEMEMLNKKSEISAAIEEDFANQLASTETAKLLEKMINEIRFSTNYIVDIHEKKGILKKVNTIEIRKAGQQNRHVTPIGLIERIVKGALQLEEKVAEIINNLLATNSEFFEPFYDIKMKTYSLGISEHFKSKPSAEVNDLNTVIKLIAHLYHHIPFLTFNKEHVKIPYHIYDCYIIPTLVFGGKKYIHGGEGSFINGLLGILDGFERQQQLSGGLSKTRQAQLIYCIFAIFDFLPLPKEAKKLKAKPNPLKHRYVGEKFDRLCSIAATHLLFFSIAYPLLFRAYFELIQDDFLSYLTNGVSTDKLCAVLGVKTIEEVVNKFNSEYESVLIDEGYVLQNFTNKGKNRGFIEQYRQQYTNENNFLKALKDQVEGLLKPIYDSNFFFDTSGTADDSKKSVESEGALRKEHHSENIKSLTIEILKNFYFYAGDFDFKKLSSYLSSTGGKFRIDMKKFHNNFQSVLEKDFQELIDTDNNNVTPIADYIKQINKGKIISIENKEYIIGLIRQAIEQAYDNNNEPSFESEVEMREYQNFLASLYKKMNSCVNPSIDSNLNSSYSDPDYTPDPGIVSKKERLKNTIQGLFLYEYVQKWREEGDLELDEISIIDSTHTSEDEAVQKVSSGDEAIQKVATIIGDFVHANSPSKDAEDIAKSTDTLDNAVFIMNDSSKESGEEESDVASQSNTSGNSR